MQVTAFKNARQRRRAIGKNHQLILEICDSSVP